MYLIRYFLVVKREDYQIKPLRDLSEISRGGGGVDLSSFESA